MYLLLDRLFYTAAAAATAADGFVVTRFVYFAVAQR